MQPSGIIATGGMWSALDPATGKILWQTAEPTGSWAFGPVSVANGVVYAGAMDPKGYMRALDAATGKILWSFASGGSVASGPAIADGMVFWGSGYEHLNSPTDHQSVSNKMFYAFEPAVLPRTSRLSFDGFRAIAEGAHMRLDLFAMKPVENNLGWFDDVPNHAQSVWGSYLTVPAPIVSRGQADFYYVGLDTKSVTYNRGTADELRHTVGTRVFHPIGKGLDYNWEADYQWGTFGSDSIRAWSVSTETGFTFDHLRFHPRPLLRADVYSGDGNPASQTLGTFNSLFPRGAYFSPKAVPFLGPQNLIDLHPVLQFQLKTNVTGAFAWDWYWRESTQDGIYAFGSGVLIDPAGASHARYLGNQGDLEIRWAPVQHIIMAFNFAGFEPGTFFKTVTYNAAPIAANVGCTYRFQREQHNPAERRSIRPVIGRDGR
jgi:hypothetical protein